MTNDKKKKIILIVVLVLVMVVLVMSLNSCSNSVEEDKVVQKNATKKKFKSQDTTKVDEKKDETEVKQEEKKEETAKSDSSNKSNISESKKDDTVSTSSKPSNSGNSSSLSKPSNNSGSNSSSSKPTEHKHDWVAQYETVNVPEKGHNEQVLVQAAYDEQVPATEMQAYSICNDCGADITGNTWSHVKDHMINDTGNGGYHTEWRETVVGYKTVHHDAVYETRYVVDSPATTKQELTGYKCSGCGKTRSN